MEAGTLAKRLRIRSEGNRVFLPTTARVDLGFPVEQRDFEEGFAPVRSYKDVVDVPSSLRPHLPSSFDVVGDIAVLKLPEELRAHREAIGDAILRWNPKLRVVLEDRGVKGEHRIRDVDVLAGEPRTGTVHVEHGLRYRVDLSHAYFSPRLASERMLIADLTREGETVADPFAGVGPYAILISKRRRPRVVFASDASPQAVELLRANVAMNRADRVTVAEGDARAILAGIAPVDRILLDLPHSASEFLRDAFAALPARGTIHLYRIIERAEEEDVDQAVRNATREAGFRHLDIRRRHVRAYSPTRHQVAFDITVARA